MKCSLLILGMIWLLTGIVAAQDSAPWPPDPTTLFAPGVEIVHSDIQPRPSAPLIDWDNTTHILYIRDSATGEYNEYPYPDSILSIFYPSKLDDGTWIVSAQEDDPVTQADQKWIWFIDPVTGVFSRYPAYCGQVAPLEIADVEEINWILFTDPDTGDQYLCKTATGERSPALPTGWEWYDISDSPDGQWVAVFAFPKVLDYQVHVFSYEVATGLLREIGSFVPDYNLFFQRWVGSQVLIGTSEMPEWFTRYIVIADAARVNSVEVAVARLRFWPSYFPNPPRYEFISGTEGGSFSYCEWIIYDISTRVLTRRNLGSLCEPEIGRLTETAYYRDVSGPQASQATLVRFNAVTGERKDLFIGEIEDVIWVSADEHYAILSLDNSGQIDLISYIPTDMGGSLYSANLSYVDLVSGEVLFSIPGGWVLDNGYWIMHSSIYPLNDGTFLAIAFSNYYDYQESYASLFYQASGQYVETRLVNNVIAATQKYIILKRHIDNGLSRFDVYNTETATVHPLIQSIDLENYDLDLYAYNDGRFSAYLRPRFGDESRSAWYTLTLPTSEISR